MFKILLSLILCISATKVQALDSYADLVEKLMPAVVNISTEKEIVNDDGSSISNMMLEPDLKGRESLGSGFFIRKDGHILTNAHVIKGAKKISVITNSDITYQAKVIGIDTLSDLAVLKIEDKNKSFETAKFGNDEEIRIGDIVLAFGNPYGLGISVSQGIISGKARNIGFGKLQYLQTDAAINQGNSGGPLFNIDGEVIGVNAALFTVRGASGVGFALPSKMANWISSQLILNGTVKRGWLGMEVANGLDRYTGKSGFVITEINEESAAYKEGLRVGDIIIAYNDTPADNLVNFTQFTETLDVGQVVRIKSLSFGQEIRNVLRIQEMPSTKLKEAKDKALKEAQKLQTKELDKNVVYISELKIAVKEYSPRGLLITKIERKSPLKGKGIKSGDIILEADRADIYSPDNLLDCVRNAIVDDYNSISLLIQGNENSFYSVIDLVHEND